MSEVVGKALGNYIGEFVDYDPTNNSSIWRNCISIRVRVDVRQPLKKDRKIGLAGGEWSMAKFRYEKLSTFCFMYGCLGHTEQKCEVFFAKDQDDGVRGWGMELGAEPRR